MPTASQALVSSCLLLSNAVASGAAPLLTSVQQICADFISGQGTGNICPLQTLKSSATGPLVFANSGTGLGISGTSVSVNYDLSATADYGILKSDLKTNYFDDQPDFSTVSVLNEFQDVLTVTTLSDATQGVFHYELSIDGTAQVSATGLNASAQAYIRPFLTGSNLPVLQTFPLSGPFNMTFAGDVPITFGQPFTIQAGFEIAMNAIRSIQPACPIRRGDVVIGCGFSGSALLDFSNTAEIQGIAVFDSAGHPLPVFNLDSQAGGFYETPSTTTPEPSQFMPIFALAVIFTYRWTDRSYFVFPRCCGPSRLVGWRRTL